MADDQGKKDTPNPLAKELYTKAAKFFDNGQFEKAVELYTQAINLDPTYSNAYFNRAISYAVTGKYEEAKKDLEVVMKYEPDSFDAPFLMGNIAEQQHDYEGAKEWYEKALQKNPNYERAKVELSRLKEKIEKQKTVPNKTQAESIHREGSNSDVLHFYLAALEKEPNNARICIEIARYYARDMNIVGNYYAVKNDLNAALTYAKRALSIGISEPNDYYLIGLIAERLGDYNTAIEMYSKALEIAPDDRTLRLYRANVYYLAEKYDEAINDCTYLLSLNPNDLEVLKSRAYVYSKSGKSEMAEKDFIAFLEIGSRNEGSYDANNAPQNARSDVPRFYLSALEKEPNNAHLCIELARYYSGSIEVTMYYNNNFDPKTEWTYAEKALSIGISDPNDYYFIGYLEEQRRLLDTAIEIYNKALEIAPDDRAFRLRRANAYYLAAKYDEAINDCNYLLSLNPKDAGALKLRAYSYAKSDNRDMAVKDFVAASEIAPIYMLLFDSHEYLLLNKEDRTESRIFSPSWSPHSINRPAPSFMLKEKPSVNFSDVVGLEVAKRELRRHIVLPLSNPELAKEYGIEAGGGIILYGPPGCGKTFIVKALAGESNANMINLKISDVLRSLLGHSEMRIRRAFEEARAKAPAIIFMDEFDLLGAARADYEFHGYRSITNTLLEELDGLSSSNKNVLVLAATNAPWLIDPAFKRPGRFDKQIYVPPPDEKQRAELFRLYLKGRPLEDNINYDELASKSTMCTSADIAGICNSAMEDAYEIAATTGNKMKVGMEQLLNTIASWKRNLPEWYENAKEALNANNLKSLYPELAEEIVKYEKGDFATYFR